MMSIQKSQIDYVLALAKTGSFSQAAELCYITQSTLSTMIRKYEDSIGIQLFDRKKKPIKPTPEGVLIIEQLLRLNHEFDSLEELSKEIKGEIIGGLEIGVIPTIAPFLLPLFLNSLIRDYPTVQFSIHELTTDEIIRRIKRRDLDLAIVSTPLDEPELREIPLFLEDFVLYETRTLSEAKRYKVEDIDLNRLWLLEEGHCMRNQVDKICALRQQRSIHKHLVYRSGSIYSLIEMVKANSGITLLPRLAVQNNPLLDPKHIYPLELPVPTREIGLVTHVNFVKNRILKVLEKRIRASVKGKLTVKDQPHSKIKPF